MLKTQTLLENLILIVNKKLDNASKIDVDVRIYKIKMPGDAPK